MAAQGLHSQESHLVNSVAESAVEIPSTFSFASMGKLRIANGISEKLSWHELFAIH